MKRLRMMDTFSGIAGFSLAARWTGQIDTIQFIEIEPFCQRVIAKHFPGAPIHGDIRTFDGKPFRGRVDILTGGFPCQDVSDAGLRTVGIEGQRSGLWSEMHRIISEVRPHYVLVENVTGLLRRGMGKVLGDLAEIGYDAEWSIVSACSLGAPHTRKRVFILAYPHSYADSLHSVGLREKIERAWRTYPGRKTTWDTEPPIRRVANGIPAELDRNRGLGNAIVPQVAYLFLQAIVDMEAGA